MNDIVQIVVLRLYPNACRSRVHHIRRIGRRRVDNTFRDKARMDQYASLYGSSGQTTGHMQFRIEPAVRGGVVAWASPVASRSFDALALEAEAMRHCG